MSQSPSHQFKCSKENLFLHVESHPIQPQALDANPCVVLQYCGQAAYLMDHPDKYTDAFWSAVPTPIFWPMFVFGTLAAIVASQAIPCPLSTLFPPPRSISNFNLACSVRPKGASLICSHKKLIFNNPLQ